MGRRGSFYQIIEEICAQDTRYKPDSYEFVMQALHFTQNKLKMQTHVTGRQLLEGIREFAIGQYGVMAKTVFKHWGITRTDDFGNIVFNMIHKKLLSKTEEDTIDDFKGVWDFEAVFGNILHGSTIEDK